MAKQYELGLEGNSFRESLIQRLVQEAREEILLKSKYGTLDGMTYAEKVEYMRYIFEERYRKPSSDLSDKQMFPIYANIQRSEISRYFRERIPEVEARVKAVSDIGEYPSDCEMSLTDIVLAHIIKK